VQSSQPRGRHPALRQPAPADAKRANPAIPPSLRLPDYRPEPLFKYGEPFADDSRINKDRFRIDPYLRADHLDNP